MYSIGPRQLGPVARRYAEKRERLRTSLNEAERKGRQPKKSEKEVTRSRLYQKQLEIAEKLRVSEREYRELFESAHDGIWAQDLDGNLTDANKAAGRLVGCTPLSANWDECQGISFGGQPACGRTGEADASDRSGGAATIRTATD